VRLFALWDGELGQAWIAGSLPDGRTKRLLLVPSMVDACRFLESLSGVDEEGKDENKLP